MAKGRKTGGRKAGTPNKLTAKVRDNFAQTFEALGGVEALTAWAEQHPTEFYKLFAKLMPSDMNLRSETLADLVTASYTHKSQ